MKGPETDSNWEHKAIPKTEKLRQILLCYPIKLAFYCLFVLLFHYFYLFYFVSFLFLFFLFSFFHFICSFNCIFDWFSLFSLYCISIFLLSLHLCSNNTLLLIVYPEGHFTIVKGRIHQEDINIVNIYAPNIGAPKYIKKILELSLIHI